VAAIEAREREERILQGYLLPDGSEAGERQVPASLGGDQGQIEGKPFASAGGSPHASAKFAYPPAPREKMPAKGSAPVAEPAPARPGEAGGEVPGPEEGETGHGTIAPPRPKVDALSTDPETLRRLAEEDTRRRLRESGVSEAGVGEEGVKGVGRGFRPRRRGA
jgi:NADH dehydrogenase [ubiquinone] 1 alpha subcomplex assembly factor 2